MRRCAPSCDGTPRKPPGISDPAREGLGHRHADPGGFGAAGSQAEEEDVEQGLDEPPRPGCQDREDERRLHASGPQSRACRGSGHRGDRRGHRTGADEGDTTTIVETTIAAAEQVEDAQTGVKEPQKLEEIIGDKGYHSNLTMRDLDAVGIRSYIAEPNRGRRDWSEEPEAQAPVYRNRRRIRGPRGRRLMRRRGELIERSFAHVYDTGAMRRTHLRGHSNILKRLLIHAGGFNLGLVMRQVIGLGTPRGLQDCPAVVLATVLAFLSVAARRVAAIWSSHRLLAAMRGRVTIPTMLVISSSAEATCTTGS
jgi:hypothetical protein